MDCGGGAERIVFQDKTKKGYGRKYQKKKKMAEDIVLVYF
jgi:hypothetical protein